MKIVIIGGSHAGIACAIRAREEYPDSKIVIYEKQKSIGFIAQSIPFYLSGDTNFLKMSSYITAEQLENLGVLVKTRTLVKDVDMEAKTLIYTDVTSGEDGEDNYDKLVLATGSYPSLPLVQGEFQDKVYVVKKFEDAVSLKKAMHESRSAIVIGGGAIGAELAKILNQEHIRTTLIHSSSYILNRYFEKEVAENFQDLLAGEGVEICLNSIVTEIQEQEYQEGNHTRKRGYVKTRDGREFVADMVIYATGFRPNSFLVAEQVELGDKGAIWVDDYMQTSQPDVFAVGDCATTKLTNVKEPVYVPHASDAIRQGELVAVNLVDKKIKLGKSQGTYRLNNFDSENIICSTGLTSDKAKSEGFDCEISFVRDDYVQNSDYFESWMIYEKGTHKILGIQSMGTAVEIAAHADLISLAIQNDMTVEEIEYTDFYFKHGFKNPRSFTKMHADKIRQQERMAERY